MTKRVLLIDVDSTIPNIALMKYSTYYKKKGYEVGFNTSDPDIIVASIIFDKNKHVPNSWEFFYPGVEKILGGPGYDPTIQLPEEIEREALDYTLYPDYHDSIGRVTIGCVRKCYFCKVPQMGGLRYVRPVWDQYQGGVMRLLDDNIFAHKKAWHETAEWFIENDVVADFDALDIRLMRPEIAEQLRQIKPKSRHRFAFDITAYEKAIRKGHAIAREGGVSKGHMMYYIYLHDEANIPDAKYRFSIVKDEFGAMPYIMPNQENMTPWIHKIKQRGCNPALTGSLTTEQVFSKDPIRHQGRWV